MADRRKHIEQLPLRIQTQYREKQFASTVDQVFQPGNVDSLTGYIGRKPGYYNATTDLYIGEPTTQRQNHQLEPAMVSRDVLGAVTDILSYDDFINYLDQNNGITTDHNRLFADDYYTWAPPVDLDKLNNHTSYYWFGDNPGLLPVLTLTSPVASYTGDGTTLTYLIPPRGANMPASSDSVMVLVAGVASTRWTVSSATQITFGFAPASGQTIQVYRYGDLSTLIAGQSAYNPALFNTQGVSALTSGMRVQLQDGLAAAGEARSFWVEGVGTTIDLVAVSDAPTTLSATPAYVTIDRRSADQNLWSQSNYWVHEAAFAWANVSFDTRIAQRPIIEYIPDLELYNYGTRRVPDTITCKVSGNPLFGANIFTRQLNQIITDYEFLPWDDQPYQSDLIVEIQVQDINAGLIGSIYVDAQHVLAFGDSLLVVNNSNPAYNNCILRIDSVIDPTTQQPIFAAVVSHVPQYGDTVIMPVQGLIAWDETSEGFDTNPLDANAGSIEYHFDGLQWTRAQVAQPMVDPLFNLYDQNGIMQGTLPGSTFAGNRIFGYAAGTGVNDTVLGRPLSYDGNGNVLFSNDLFNTRATSSTGAPVGFQYFKVNAPSGAYLGNGWLKSETKTVQSQDSDGIWSIPQNLSANPDNEQVDQTTKPEWFAQFAQIVSSQDGIIGPAYALNNYRDTAKDASRANKIIQNESPMLKAMLLASDAQFDLFVAGSFVEREYARFRNKFFQQITTVYQNGTCTTSQQPSVWVTTILEILRTTKQSDSPFFGSTMAGGLYFVPTTPAFLGLMPCVQPEIVVDTSYSQPVTMIVGHDGNRTPATLDYRDTIMLALEQAIYDSIPAAFKSGASLPFTFDTYRAGWSRPYVVSKTYSPTDIATILSPYFIKWTQINNFDYADNSGYIASNPFTWNYRGTTDIYGNAMAGNWRAVYRFMFDTDAPNTRPWEMIGFSSKPSWFDLEYGVAPYTSGNTHLWDDIRDGVIRQGPRQGIDPNYVRPNLYAILPVDADGNLLDPLAIGLIERAPVAKLAAANWIIGDHGPVENLWINSPSYPYAKALAAFLMRPAEYVEACWATQDKTIVNDQTIDVTTLDRSQTSQIVVHGETVGTTRVTKIGLQQWLVDMLMTQGLQPSLLGNAMRGANVQLAHKMAGFTQQTNLRVRAETIGILPNEDVEVVFYEPAPFRSSTYSNIIIEWVGTGWSVVGYDNLNNVFKTLQGDPQGPTTTISLGQNPAIYEWRAGVSYPVNRLVTYQGNLYKCVVAHVATAIFATQNWAPATDVVFFPEVDVYNRTTGVVGTVPYGTVFTTPEDVALFIRDYFRWLENEGWVFDDFDPITQQVQDWNMLIKQFLEWTQINYVPGNFIALAPGASNLTFVATHGQAYNMLASNGAAGIVNRQGRPMPTRNVIVTRDADTTTITTATQDLAAARVSLGEIEHIVLFSNTTVFNDLLYQPLYDIRIDRLYVIGNRVAGWTGRRDAAGYIIVDNDLLPSFVKAEDDIRHAFEIESSEDPVLRQYARHVIGYQSRPYLDNLLVDETEQFEFYQGMIQEKGTAASFSRITRSHFIEQNADIAFLEEWALRLANYGAVDKDTTLSFTLAREDIRQNPQYIQFGVQQTSNGQISLPSNDPRWIEAPQSATVFPVLNQDQTLATGFGVPRFEFNPFDNPQTKVQHNATAYSNAGYVRVNEVDQLYCFKYTDLDNLYQNAKTLTNYIQYGSRIWVYDRGDGNFDVLRAANAGATTNPITKIETIAEDNLLSYGYARITFTYAHGLGVSDVGLNVILAGLTGTTIDMEGATTITRVDSTTSIIVVSSAISGYDYTTAGILGYAPPPFYVLRSMHFATIADAKTFWTRFVPDDQTMIYVDDAGNGTWAVYLWSAATRSWSIYREQPAKLDSSRITRPVIYDTMIQYASGQMIPNPVLLDTICVLDPIAGLLPGDAMREISYVLDYDPAVYGETLANFWGKPQVGQLWWDLSTVRFLVAETDTIYVHDDAQRTANELAYRQAAWGNAAPGSSIDVYEWTRSLEYPTAYTGNGALLDAVNPSFIAAEEYDPDSGTVVIAYYFWVSGQTVVPNRNGRAISALATATILANPRTNDLPWIAPIAPNAFLLCNIEQYVNDDTTAFELSIRDDTIQGVKHDEWQLTAKLDGRSTAPEDLWKALRGSLIGFDDQGAPLPSPLLQASQQVGYGLGKTLIANGRTGMLAARKTFVQTVNAIFARTPIVITNPSVLTAMAVTSPTYPTLDWRSKDVRTSFAIPPNGSYTASVVGHRQRDALLRESVFKQIRGYNIWESDGWELLGWEADTTHSVFNQTDMRLLVINPDGDAPSWSIWEIDPAQALASEDPNDWLILSHGYTATAPSYADMLTNTYTAGDRILVLADENASGFWTTWEYAPNNRASNSSGFKALGSQTYRTSDFWGLVDWYATGYSSSNQPSVHYASLVARNTAEGLSPTNLLVQIDDIGNGTWAWTYFDGTEWTYVARQSATIALNDLVYDDTRTVFGYSNTSLSAIANRDGSLELQTLIDILRTTVLSDGELNELWFSMLHFLHTQQNEIEWAFKTSFLSVDNFNETLGQAPIQALDNTDNLLEYIDEIKPYRVKTRDFVRTVSPPIDVATSKVMDFDRPVYFDTVTQTWRRLNVTVPGDITIMQSTLPYSDWYANYLNTSIDPTSPDYNPVRRMDVTLMFDRVDPGSTPLGTTGALAHIEALYAPTEGMENETSLIADNGSLDEPSLDGTGDGILQIDGNASPSDLVLSGGHSIRRRRAEELASLLVDDAVSMTIHQVATVGAPHQIERFSKRKTATITIDCVVIPADETSVLVFFDGVRAEASTYSVDLANHLVTITPPSPRPSVFMVHAIGIGGITLITEQRAFDGDGTTTSFDLQKVPQGYLDVYLGDDLQAPSTYSVSGSTVTFTSAPGNVGILIYARNFLGSAGTDTATRAVRQTLTGSSPYTITDPTKIAFGPEHVGTIVELNGVRLHHPFTRYASFNASTRATTFRAVTDMTKLKIWLGTTPYTGIVEQLPSSAAAALPSGYIGKYDEAGWDDEMLWDIEGDVTLYRDDIVSNNPTLMSDIIITSYESPDFDVSSGVLTVDVTVGPSDVLEVTTFHNADLMQIETSSFYGSADGLYQVPMTAGDSYLVAVNGLTLTRGLDYEVKLLPLGFDQSASDEGLFDGGTPTRQIVVNRVLAESDRLDIMGFTGRVASDEFYWHTASNRPAPQMMGLPLTQYIPPPPPSGQWDELTWENDQEGWDKLQVPTEGTMGPVTATSSQGLRDVFGMRGTWDMSTWRPADAGRLVGNLLPTDTSVQIALNPFDIASEDIQPYAFALPARGSIGVLWVEGERIEYTSCAIANNVATLSGLRRATHGTSIGGEQRRRATYQGDGQTATFTLNDPNASAANIASEVEVSVISNNQKIAQRAGVHYTVSAADGVITVVFGLPPLPGKTVLIAHTSGYYHPASTLVFTDNVGILVPAEE